MRNPTPTLTETKVCRCGQPLRVPLGAAVPEVRCLLCGEVNVLVPSGPEMIWADRPDPKAKTVPLEHAVAVVFERAAARRRRSHRQGVNRRYLVWSGFVFLLAGLVYVLRLDDGLIHMGSVGLGLFAFVLGLKGLLGYSSLS